MRMTSARGCNTGSSKNFYHRERLSSSMIRMVSRRILLVSTLLLAVTQLHGCVRAPAPTLTMRWGVIENLPGDRFRGRISLDNSGDAPLPETGWTLYFNFLRMVIPESVPAEISIRHVNGDLVRLDPADGFRPIQPGEQRTFEFEAVYWAINVSDAPAGPYLVFHSSNKESERIVALGDVVVDPFLYRRQTDRGADDALPVASPAAVFDRNTRQPSVSTAVPITPTPVMMELDGDSVSLDHGVTIQFSDDLSTAARLLADDLRSLFSINPTLQDADADSVVSSDVIRLRQRKEGFPPGVSSVESYRLTASPNRGVEIIGASPAAVFYGTRTLLALIPAGYYRRMSGLARLPSGHIMDSPRFGYRGMHLDVARNFQSKEAVLKLLDLMSFYKLNKFHFHLTDDEGWRLEITDLPELTEVGSLRGHADDMGTHVVPSFGSSPFSDAARSHGSGHYTRSDFIEILKFAADRSIETIPEIDVPGHARAAIVSMEARRRRLMALGDTAAADEFVLRHEADRSTYMSVQHWTDNVIDVCMPSTYAFVEHVVDEVIEMYREARVSLTALHMGGDEVPEGVWAGSPACQDLLEQHPEGRGTPRNFLGSYFLTRVNEILEARDLTTAGWEEIVLTSAPGQHVAKPNRSLLGKGYRPYVWATVLGGGSEDLAYRLANAGFDVVMSSASNLYLDMAYEKHPLEPGYYWAGFVDTRKVFEFAPLNIFATASVDAMGHPIPPGTYQDSERLTPEGRARIIGIQGQLWGENVKGEEMLDYLAFPKLLGLAERAWSAVPSWESEELDEVERSNRLESDWAEFAQRLGQYELPRLDVLYGGVDYRLPPPGVRISDGTVAANSVFPELAIRFTRDGSAVDATSELYVQPVAGTGEFVFRTFDTRGRGSRSVRPE